MVARLDLTPEETRSLLYLVTAEMEMGESAIERFKDQGFRIPENDREYIVSRVAERTAIYMSIIAKLESPAEGEGTCPATEVG